MTGGMAEAEAAVEEGESVAQVPVDLAAEIVFGMERAGDDAEGHGLVVRVEAKQPVHWRRPVHVAAGEIPAPYAAAGQRLGQLARKRAAHRSRRGGSEIPKSAGKEREHETGEHEKRDLQPRSLPPIGKGRVDRLDERKLRVTDVAHGHECIGPVRQSETQDAGLRPEGGEEAAGGRER